MKPLSPKNILNVLVFPVLLLLTLTFLLIPGGFPWISNPGIAILLYTILFVWIFAAAIRTYDLHYDGEFLYLKRIGETRKIPLSAIKQIQRSNDGIKVKGLSSWRYTIEFHSSTNIVDQSIYEVIGSRKVEEFVDIVKQVNSTVLVC